VESELGMIPEGWKVSTLGEYCKVKSGFAFKSSWWQDNGLKVIKIKNITSNGVLDMSDCSFVSTENTLKAKDFKTNVGDLLIAMTGATIGKFCMISSEESMYVNQRVGKFFLGNNPIIKLPFIYCSLKTERIYSEIVNKGQGSAQPNISSNDIESIRIPLPMNMDFISLFNDKLKGVFEKMIHNQQEITHLTNLRDTLLPKLMSGEIDVNEVEI
jgi:type I restriction enzyme S subunit